MKNRTINFALSLLVATLICGTPARAQGADFNQAVIVFNAGQYPQAADMFVQYLRQNPQDALAHYYLGVTWHCLGRASEAGSEYQWVKANSADPELQKRVDMGLQVISRMQPVNQPVSPVPAPTTGYQQPAPSYPSGGYGYQPPAPAGYGQQQMPYGDRGGGTTGWLSSSGAQQAAQAQGATVPNVGMQGRIIDLYTTWCGWCKRFEPIFMQAQSKYGSAIQFTRLNAELPPNTGLVKKYKVKGYPTVLLLDNSGKLVQRIDGAPQSLQDFEQTIFAAYPALRSPQ